MRAVRPSLLFLATLALALPAGLAAADEPSGDCAPPTEELCKDPDYRATACGESHAADCADVLQATFQREWNASSAPTQTVLRPVQAPGQSALTSAKVSRFQLSSLQSDQPASSTFVGLRTLQTLSNIGAIRTWSRRLVPYPPLMSFPIRPAVRSCSDYIYKKWWDYARFEEQANTCGNDDECVFQKAHDQYTGIYKPVLRSYDLASTPLPYQLAAPSDRQWEPYPIEKNAFYDVNPDDIIWQSAYSWGCSPFMGSVCPPDSEQTRAEVVEIAQYTHGRGRYLTHDLLGWHQQMHDAWVELDVTLDEQADIARRLARHRALTADYHRLRRELRAAGYTVSPQGVFTFDAALATYSASNEHKTFLQASYNMTVNLLTGGYLEEWRHRDPRTGEIDHGCLGSTRCDWSPARFKEQYLGLYQSEREQQLSRCNRLTGNRFSIIPEATQVADGLAGTRDWAHLERWLLHKEREIDALAASVPYKNGHARGDGGKHRTLRWSVPAIHQEYGQKHLLYARYDQAGFVELGVDAVSRSGVPRICRATGAFFAQLYAEANWIDNQGLHEHVFIDALVAAGLERYAPFDENNADVRRDASTPVFDYRAWFKVLDEYVFRPTTIRVNAGDTWVGPNDKRVIGPLTKTQPFSILGIPAYAQIQLSGTPSYDSRITVPKFDNPLCSPASELSDENAVTHSVRAELTGHVSIDAVGRLAVGIPGLSAGIKGHLEVVRATVPVYANLGFTGGTSNLALSFETGASLYANLLRGAISVFAEVLFWSDEIDLYRWDGIRVDEKLWHYERDFLLADVANLFPSD